MSLVVEDGSGMSNAESYVSVNDVTAYNDAHNAVAAWTSADTTARERALRLATQYLEATYNQRWLGERLTETQALAWPRSCVWLDGYVVDDGDMPRALLDATCELALRAIVSPLINDLTEPGMVDLDRVKVGPIEVEQHFVGGRGQVPIYRVVDGLLRGLVMGGDIVLRG